MQFFLHQISQGKGIVGKIKQKKRSERYIAKICSRDWAWLGVIAFTKTRSQTKIGVIPRDSAWFDMARGLGSLRSTTPYARTSDIFWCSSVFGRTLASLEAWSFRRKQFWMKPRVKQTGSWWLGNIYCSLWPSELQRLRIYSLACKAKDSLPWEYLYKYTLWKFSNRASARIPKDCVPWISGAVCSYKKLNVQFEMPPQSLSQETMISWKGKTNVATIFQAANAIPSICFWLFLAQKMIST